MIKVENIDVWGFEHAVRGMRNPHNSWAKSDSEYRKGIDGMSIDASMANNYQIGKNDLDLMKRLYKAGTEHRTYARMIQVSMDITAPLYWWKEMDRYTVGKSQVSTSTMHKIHSKEFELDDFSHEHLLDESIELLKTNIDSLNQWRNKYIIASKIDDIVGADLLPSKKTLWWQMIQLLPSSYNQKRTVTMNYENVYSMIRQRTDHKLDEWNEFVWILRDLPGVKEMFVFETEGKNDRN
jgi:hypothetical protein